MSVGSAFDRIAADVNRRFFTESRTEPAPVTDDDVTAVAARMAKAGYRFSAESAAALKAYLEGYALLVVGGVGTGKTSFFALLGGIVRVSLTELCARRPDDIEDAVRRLKDREVLIDDVGAEPEYSNYGCRMDILPWMMELRSGSEMRTHFTSNLDGKGIAKRYGTRVTDRMTERCKAFRFSGASMRRTTPNSLFVRSASSPRGWELCAERCANCRGVGCAAGIAIPPSADRSWPHPPEECARFAAKSK